MADGIGESLFGRIRAHVADTRSIFRASKGTLVDLSYAFEDLVLRDQLPSVVLSGFQHSRYWQHEAERYQQLSAVTQQLGIFAAGKLPAPDEQFLTVTLDGDDPLALEWFVIVLSEHFSVVLCSLDLQEQAEADPLRVFDTICSFEPAVVEQAVDVLLDAVRRYHPDRAPALAEACARFKPVQPPGDYMTALIAVIMDYSQQRQDNFHAALVEQRRLQETQSVLEQTLVELAVPVIPLVPGVIIMPLIGNVDARRSQQVMEALLEGIASKQADVAILDITGVPLIDTNVANNLLQTVRAANLLGAQVILTGIGADVAQTLIHLEVDFSHMQTQANLQDGIQAALALQQLQIAPLRAIPDQRKTDEMAYLSGL